MPYHDNHISNVRLDFINNCINFAEKYYDRILLFSRSFERYSARNSTLFIPKEILSNPSRQRINDMCWNFCEYFYFDKLKTCYIMNLNDDLVII